MGGVEPVLSLVDAATAQPSCSFHPGTRFVDVLRDGARVRGVRVADDAGVLVGRAPAWTAPGVLVLGDAAHPMSPVRAQGINLALRDVIVAANHLVPAAAAAGPDALDAACRAVQADARAGSWRYAVARHGARLLGRYRWAQRAWLARQRDLRFGSTAVELTAARAPVVDEAP